jgi:RimJ/RimL family protein N-acetyltransferase
MDAEFRTSPRRQRRKQAVKPEGTMSWVLQTERLQLREMTLADLDFIAAMLSDPEVMRFYPRLYTREEARAWVERQLQRYVEHGHGLWLVVDGLSGQAVGQVGLAMQEVDGALEPEIGYMIHRPFWRRGYAGEAGLEVRRYAFETRGYPRVISLIRPENEPSQGVARKLGMRAERETMFKGLKHLVFAVSSSVQ